MTQFVRPKVTDTQVRKALAALDAAFPEWQDAPRGHRFVERGWAWGYQCDPSTPVIVWEEGEYEWAIIASNSSRGIEALAKLGLWSEPGTGFALNLYRLEPKQPKHSFVGGPAWVA